MAQGGAVWPGEAGGVPAAQGGLQIARRGLVLGGLSMLGACAALKPAKETKLIVKLIAEPTVNPSPTGVPSPIQVRVYTLKADTNFVQSDAQSLWGNDAAVLGQDMLSKREFVMAPSAQDGFTAMVPSEAAIFGVVAGFREMDVAQWRAKVPIAFDETNTIAVSISELAVGIFVLTQAKPWPF